MEDILYNKTVSILGAGGLGREIASWIRTEDSPPFKILGFWDDNIDVLDQYQLRSSMLGSISEGKVEGSILIGIMDPHVKEQLFVKLSVSSNTKICSYYHSSVLIGERTAIKEGVVLFPKVIVSCDVQLGKGAFVNLGTQIGHDVKIGDFTSIMANVDMGGGVICGDKVFIGSGATLLPGVKIPDNTRIGAGSVVVKSIKEPGTYFGNPAKKIY